MEPRRVFRMFMILLSEAGGRSRKQPKKKDALVQPAIDGAHASCFLIAFELWWSQAFSVSGGQGTSCSAQHQNKKGVGGVRPVRVWSFGPPPSSNTPSLHKNSPNSGKSGSGAGSSKCRRVVVVLSSLLFTTTARRHDKGVWRTRVGGWVRAAGLERGAENGWIPGSSQKS